MSTSRTKVLYIAGWGRSGSTILGNVLGQLGGFFHTGELYYIWDRGWIQNRLCGSGTPFRECETWRNVFKEGYGGYDGIDPAQMVRHRTSSSFTKNIRSILSFRGVGANTAIEEYSNSLERLYNAIQKVTNCEVIVDSSKSPSYSYWLGRLPSIDLYVLHLVRDPRAVSYSWLRKKAFRDGGGDLQRNSLTKSSYLWMTFNTATEVLWKNSARYLRVRYEDFAAQPQAILDNIVQFVGNSNHNGESPFVGERTVKLTPNCSVSGNPVRFENGLVELKADLEWMSKMKAHRKALVNFLTWPLLIKYGYLSSRKSTTASTLSAGLKPRQDG